MSVQATSWVIEKSKHKGASLLVLLMIANHAHADGTGAYPSMRTLARECRMSERQIRRIIRLLEESGELRIEIDAGPNGVNVYCLPYVAPVPDKMSARKHPTGQDVRKTFELPDKMSQATGHFDTSHADIAMSAKPSVKPSVNRKKGEAPAPQDATPAPTQQSKQPQRDTRLTIEQLPDDWRAYCEKNRPDLNPEAVWLDFYDYWTAAPGSKGMKRDWAATWRRWVRETVVKATNSRNASTAPSAAGIKINFPTHGIWMEQQKRQRENGDPLLDLIHTVQRVGYMTRDRYQRLRAEGMPA